MRHSRIFGSALLGCALLAACSGNRTFSSPTSFAPVVPDMRLQSSLLKESKGFSVEKILYRFRGDMDGQEPESALTDVKGVLYGTTMGGGGSSCAASAGDSPGCGTIFRIDPSGANYEVHRFPVSAFGGAVPVAGVVALGGELYGTTEWGGAAGENKSPACAANAGCGTAYKINPGADSDFKVLRRFNAVDGLDEYGGVAAAGGALYGAAYDGGTGTCNGLKYSCGLIYRLSPTGEERQLHEFGHGTDGSDESYAPIAVGDTLYGATSGGGGTACTTPYKGCGTIYKMNISGSGYRILHRFKGGVDGANPNNVIHENGVLYGTTAAGGDLSCSYPGADSCGVIFRMDTDGKHFRVLYRFKGRTDGAGPNSILAEANHTLYSTTAFGGGAGCRNFGPGCGVVFKIKTSGNEYGVVYRFRGGTDGAHPAGGGPIYLDGKLYGSTEGGGSGCLGFGCGTLFSVSL